MTTVRVDFELWSGKEPNGNRITLAIDPRSLEDDMASEYFTAGTTDIKKKGEISVTGDTGDLPLYFDVTD